MSSHFRTCPDEGTLLLYLDGALEGSALREMRAHLAGCDACEERLAALRSTSEDLRALLARHDPEPPPREAYDLGHRRPAGGNASWRRWAAAAVVVVALGSLVSPVRGLIAEHVLDPVREWISGADGGEAPSGGVTASTVPSEDAASPATAFSWTGTEVTLRFVSDRTRGVLTVLPATDSLVTLWSARADVPLRVQRGTVEVDNLSTPGGEYRLAVPANVSTVRVEVGDAAEWAIPVEGLPGPRTVALSKASPSGGSPP